MTTVDVRAQVETEFDCAHATVEMRRRLVANDVTHIYRQCIACGKSFGAVGSKDLLPGLVSEMAPFDEGLREQREADRSARFRELSARNADEHSAAWWRDYNAYLQTPAWRKKRAHVMQRDKNICQGCRDAVATDVHHTTYAHLFNEPLFELHAVCRACHEQLHGRALGGN